MKYGAVIIDNRPITLDWVYESHIKHLPDHWGFQIIKNHDVRTLNDYNNLMTSRALWEAVQFDKVLVFQQDSRLLAPWRSEFEQYDFIGAPIKNCAFPAMNGGLSFRSREMMLKIIDSIPYNVSAYGFEDIYFCNQMERFGGKLPTIEVARRFSCETMFELGTIGVHAPEKYLSSEQVNKLYTQYE